MTTTAVVARVLHSAFLTVGVLEVVSTCGGKEGTTTPAPSASKLAFTVQPSNVAAGASISPAVVVAVQDAAGNTVTTATTSVTVAIGTNPAGGTLSGTTTVAAGSGVATFSNLAVDKPGSGYTLTVSAAGLAGATSGTFNVAVGAASKLAFTVQPSNVAAGASISPAVVVAVQDAAGNTVTTATTSVTVAIGTNPAGGTLSGTTTVAAGSGVATFANLSLDKAGTGYTLAASATGLTGVVSAAFNVTAGGLSGSDVLTLLRGAFRNWYHSLADADPSMTWDVTADHYESAWGDWAMKELGWEPRDYAFVNSHADATWAPLGEEIWYNNYAAVTSANLVVLALKNGTAIPGPTDSSANPMARAASRFIQGVALSQIALAYDSGYAFDETTDVARLHLVGRDSVMRAALAKLDQAISLSTGSWSIPVSFLNQIGEAWTAAQLAKVANTFAARLIAYFPHNVTENGSANWTKVLTYASSGISSGTPFDMEIIGDGPSAPNGWYNDHLGFGDDFQVWARADFRVACLLDPTYKCHKANNGIFDRMINSQDRRFNGGGAVGDNCLPRLIISISHIAAGRYCTAAGGTGNADFIYDTLVADWPAYSPARGYYRFSALGHIRYWDASWASGNSAVGKLPFVLAAENDLLWAEAILNTTGPSALAAAKINDSRVTRGGLPALTGAESKDAMLAQVRYEKAIELYATGDRVAWYDARRWAPNLVNPHYYTAASDSDQTGWLPYGQGLQPQSVRLMPVPAQELTVLGDPIYTFGGPGNPEPPAPPAGGSAPVRRSSSIFGRAPDGRVILGPGKYNVIADAIFAANQRMHRSLRSRKR